MNIKPIRSSEECVKAMERIEKLWDVEPGTDEADELEVLAVLVDDYERRTIHFPPVTHEQFMEDINYHANRLIYDLGLEFPDAYAEWSYRQKIKWFVHSMKTGEG